MLIRLTDMCNRPYATRSTPMEDQWGWILSRTAERFDCDVDDVSSIEDEDGDELLVVRGEPVARISKDYGMGATI